MDIHSMMPGGPFSITTAAAPCRKNLSGSGLKRSNIVNFIHLFILQFIGGHYR